MDKQEKYTEDLLSQYINPERIEKAPEGFTSQIMSLIESEKVEVKPVVKYRKRALVPYIFSAFIILLVIISVFLPGSENQTLIIPALEYIKSIKFTLPEIELGKLLSIDFPSTMIYGLFGILLLSVFDKALYWVFHREK